MRLGLVNTQQFLDLGEQICKLQKQYQQIKQDNAASVDRCYVVCIKRISGNEMLFHHKIKRNFILTRCGQLLNGISKKELKTVREKLVLQAMSNSTSCTGDYDTDVDDEFGYDKSQSLKEGFCMDVNTILVPT